MHVNLESKDPHSIEGYTDKMIQINGVIYESSCIITSTTIESNWPIYSINDLNPGTLLNPLLNDKPKIILIGQMQLNSIPPAATIQFLAEQSIGLEIMSIGSACRTFNVLLNEKRPVVLGIIFE